MCAPSRQRPRHQPSASGSRVSSPSTVVRPHPPHATSGGGTGGGGVAASISACVRGGPHFTHCAHVVRPGRISSSGCPHVSHAGCTCASTLMPPTLVSSTDKRSHRCRRTKRSPHMVRGCTTDGGGVGGGSPVGGGPVRWVPGCWGSSRVVVRGWASGARHVWIARGVRVGGGASGDEPGRPIPVRSRSCPGGQPAVTGGDHTRDGPARPPAIPCGDPTTHPKAVPRLSRTDHRRPPYSPPPILTKAPATGTSSTTATPARTASPPNWPLQATPSSHRTPAVARSTHPHGYSPARLHPA